MQKYAALKKIQFKWYTAEQNQTHDLYNALTVLNLFYYYYFILFKGNKNKSVKNQQH